MRRETPPPTSAPKRSLRKLRLVYVPLLAGMVALLTLAFLVPQPDLFDLIARSRGE